MEVQMPIIPWTTTRMEGMGDTPTSKTRINPSFSHFGHTGILFFGCLGPLGARIRPHL